MAQKNEPREIYLMIIFALLILLIATASSPIKKPKKIERTAKPIAYQYLNDSVKVWFVWTDSSANKIMSADTSVFYHKSQAPGINDIVTIKIR
jgi:flagellar basal body L-ring protein FlgH